MKVPIINKRVLAWVEEELYPFVGYWDGKEWLMEVGYLNADVCTSDIFGEVIDWIELPEN